ncbi:ribosomal protein 60S [Methanohalobium evestigatum Z-7303]|uniref:Large ribosomal subunit protein P1 n=1 Tax=Methanohalobium evestigatum (strain ATCC BAA-1072 / DSM 3721 / NBRC 107634 / OCM 161 / Z-7303) TaxID=644295 RepID=D7EAE2_METEZ|nr:50S ribosomal protein P1 [Methanohalobium evestigatum]ADI74941.1 ribosomal protein 60S [Methanohalobium evestigatum Z-7303]
MEYIYAALLLHNAGKDITEDTVKNVLDAAGIEVDDARVKALVAALEDVDIEEAMSQAAFAAPAAGGSSPSGESGGAAEESAAEEKEEEEEEESEESGMAGLGALFG